MKALNEELLKGNTCFGCGPENPNGLHIRIFRDGDRDDRLVGTYRPRPGTEGFPHIVHGGLQFTALDCMAGWVMFALRAKGGRFVPLTKSASMRYRAPATLRDAEFKLTAQIVKEGPDSKTPVTIRCELLDEKGTLLSEGDFEYVLLPEAVFKKAVGISEMPDSYRRHFGDLA